jgi:hypothetical protein
MRVLTLLLICVALSVSLLLGIQLAAAGAPDAPEVSDASGDCAVPYGNEYLDITAAWIDNEDADSFDVHLALAKWNEQVAEGSGFAVQFSHQGVRWGIVAVYSSVLTEGWEFSTGVATAQLAEGFEDAPGSFDAASASMVVTFPKSLFPHEDPTDRLVRDFQAMSADLRPAYPFFLGEEAGLDGNGRWVVCDDATSAASYELTGHGAAAGEHAQHDGMAGDNATADASVDASAPTTQDPAPADAADEKSVPMPFALVALALALALALRR